MGLINNKRSDFEEKTSGTPQSRPEVAISEDLMARHEESKRHYPNVHLTKGEYVVLEVRRHPIGILSIWALTIVLAILAIAFIPFYGSSRDALAVAFDLGTNVLPDVSIVMWPAIILCALFVTGGFVAAYVYNGNLFYLTNESIIQYEQTSIFSIKQQQINLVNVDDVSYRQQGILQHFLDYGTIRVSTEGDEKNPYVFYYVAHPQAVIRTINDAMEDATGFAVRYRQHKSDKGDPTLPPPEQF